VRCHGHQKIFQLQYIKKDAKQVILRAKLPTSTHAYENHVYLAAAPVFLFQLSTGSFQHKYIIFSVLSPCNALLFTLSNIDAPKHFLNTSKHVPLTIVL
jgi:hypothetical protein